MVRTANLPGLVTRDPQPDRCEQGGDGARPLGAPGRQRSELLAVPRSCVGPLLVGDHAALTVSSSAGSWP